MSVKRIAYKNIPIYLSYALIGSFTANDLNANKVVAQKKEGEAPQASLPPASPIPQAGSQEGACLTFLAMGTQSEQVGQLDQALQYYKAAALVDPAKAEPYIKATETRIQQERDKKQEEETELALERSARQGNAADALRLGKARLDKGKIDLGIEMLNLASQYKNSEAPYILAKMYETGDRVPVDLEKAETYYEIGAQNGNPECAYIQAKLLELKSKEIQDIKAREQKSNEAQKWLKEAADRGHAKAAFEFFWTMVSKGMFGPALEYMEKARITAKDDTSITIGLRDLVNFCGQLARWGQGLPINQTLASAASIPAQSFTSNTATNNPAH